jgi:hypothetical protein
MRAHDIFPDFIAALLLGDRRAATDIAAAAKQVALSVAVRGALSFGRGRRRQKNITPSF